MKSIVFFFAVVLASSVSAQTDVCGPQNRFVELLHEVIESKVNSTWVDDLRVFVEREVEWLVSGAIDQRIEGKVNRTLTLELSTRVNETIKNALIDEPVIRTISLGTYGVREVTMGVRGTSLGASLSISNPSLPATSSNNLLAYRPRFNGYHSSGLGALFLNIQAIFPCTDRVTCGRVTWEEDGFNRGRPFLEAGDAGNNFRVFSSTQNIRTYGIAVEGCPLLNEQCWPNFYEMEIFCLLPRALCG